MLVLGLDPGLAITGYGLVEEVDRVMTPVAYGVVRTPAGTPLTDRLVQLREQVGRIIAEYAPDVAVVEQLFFSTNARTAMTVGHARGVLLLTLAEANLPIVEYTPMQMKQAITGYGRADKTQVQEMVRLLLSLEEIPRPDDAADALGLSICYLHAWRLDHLTKG